MIQRFSKTVRPLARARAAASGCSTPELHPEDRDPARDRLGRHGRDLVASAEDIDNVDPVPEGIAETEGYDFSPSTSSSIGLTGMIRYPWDWRYRLTSLESRSGLSDNPTTAIVLAWVRISRNSLSGTDTGGATECRYMTLAARADR